MKSFYTDNCVCECKVQNATYTIQLTSTVSFWTRVWCLVSNPFLYLFAGKLRW